MTLITEAGRRFADVAGELREVVVVSAGDVANMVVAGPAGVYVVGTGSVGVAQTFFVIGLIYFVVMMIAAFSYRIPHPAGNRPDGRRPTRPIGPRK